MPITAFSGIAAVVLYLVSLGLQGQAIKTRSARITTQGNVLVFGLLAVVAHAVSAWTLISRADGYHFGIFEVSTLIFAFISFITILSSIRNPVGQLILGVFPCAALVILLSLLIDSSYPAQQLGIGLVTHVLLSILAYSLVTLAALQSLFLAFQNYQLRHQRAATVIRRFPSLQDMEHLLFELLWAAQALLSGAIITGFLFVNDWAVQGLAHKMFFSILAWVVFAVLLWGRHQLGWRGNTAIRGTLIGFTLLVVGFYGSKFVLEYIL